MQITTILPMILTLFDGGAAAGAGAAGTSGTSGEAGTASAAAGQTTTGETPTRILYGKQAQPSAAAEGNAGTGSSSDAGSDTGATGQVTPEAQQEALRKEYRDLMQGKYKELHTQEMQRVIDRRFAETKTLEAQSEKAQPIFDALAQRYGVDAGDLDALAKAVADDDDMLSDAADNAGMSIDQYRKFQQLQQENRQLQRQQAQAAENAKQRETAEKWYGEAQALKAKFKDFDLKAELSDPNFMAALQAGVPMELVYQGKYFDRYMTSATTFAATQAQKATVDSIRAKGTRPVENGTASQSAFTVKSDPSKLTLKDFEEIARRSAHGERIAF